MSKKHFDDALRFVTEVKPVSSATVAHTTNRAVVITNVANFVRQYLKDLVDNWETQAKATPVNELRAHRAGVLAAGLAEIAEYFFREVSLQPNITDPIRAATALSALMESLDTAVRQAEAAATA